jgi:hypothetical protein
MIAALAPVGVPNTDIVVTDRIGHQLCAIQVKVRRDIGSDGGWHMGSKHEKIESPKLFYCFVDFGRELAAQPKCWVVPSKIVANVLRISHQKWLVMPGKKGQSHKDTDMRRFLPSYDHLELGQPFTDGWLDQFADAWHLLAIETKSA